MANDLRPIVNVAAYCFAPLTELQDLRSRIRARCAEIGVRGTLLLAPEGVNLFMAGSDEAISRFKSVMADETGLDLEYKVSHSRSIPFDRFRIKIKREIITCDPTIDPSRQTGRKISPRDLKSWFDEGRSFVLLDTRNDYEIEKGTFEGARDLGIRDFRSFKGAVAGLLPELSDTPIVTFCTGGIRCEKAVPLMEREGFKEVYQLQGGILKYFEEVGAEHWNGSCFVFDGRGALEADLSEQNVGAAR